jgi:hypothetical protein
LPFIMQKPIAPPRTNSKLRMSKYRWKPTVTAAPMMVPRHIANPKNFKALSRNQ